MNDKLYHECYRHVCQARSLLENLQAWGFDTVTPVLKKSDVGSVVDEKIVPAPDVVKTLDELKDEVERCQRCSLARSRSKTVFARGNPRADLVFVGEAPGFEEDRQGLPFVGEAGGLLDRILFAMGLSEKDVYICNLIKCRPPANRNPAADELAACRPYLECQLSLLEPRVIVTLGRFAAQLLLAVQTPVSHLRGNWYQYQGVAVLPTFHPAFLLRSPAAKKLVWEDMKKVKQRLISEGCKLN